MEQFFQANVPLMNQLNIETLDIVFRQIEIVLKDSTAVR